MNKGKEYAITMLLTICVCTVIWGVIGYIGSTFIIIMILLSLYNSQCEDKLPTYIVILGLIMSPILVPITISKYFIEN